MHSVTGSPLSLARSLHTPFFSFTLRICLTFHFLPPSPPLSLSLSLSWADWDACKTEKRRGGETEAWHPGPSFPLYKSTLKKVGEGGKTEKSPLICTHSCDHLKAEAHFSGVSTRRGRMLVKRNNIENERLSWFTQNICTFGIPNDIDILESHARHHKRYPLKREWKWGRKTEREREREAPETQLHDVLGL